MAELPQPGTKVGRYTIGERLGQGGGGTVFRATRSMPRREVALKVIPAELRTTPGFREQFLHEADVLSGLNSPHIVAIHDVGEDDGFLFIATDLVPGGDLGTRLARGPVPLKPALTLAAQVCLALAAAHQSGIVHGDVKPSNVLLGQRDGVPHAYLCDFGIAQPEGAGGTRRSTVTGTYAYLAPEVVTGGATSAASDIYALGCLLVAAITGTPPYQGTDQEIAQQHLTSEIPHWEETSPLLGRLNQLIQVSMAKDPADRYPSADAFRAAILEVLGEVPAAAPAAVLPDAEVTPDADAEVTPDPEVAPEAPHVEADQPAPIWAAEEEAVEETQAHIPAVTAPVFTPEPGVAFTPQPTPDEPDWEQEEHTGRSSKVLLSSLVALLVVAAGVAAIVLLQKDDSGKGPSAGSTTSASPTPTPTAAPGMKICQEGREIEIDKRCGEPYGIEGLRYVFPSIEGDCTEKAMSNRTKYWEIACENDGAKVLYSIYKTTPVGRTVNNALFPNTSPITLPNGMIQFGPEQASDGTWRAGLIYPEKHPYGVLIEAGSSEAAQQIADATADAALEPGEFAVE